MTRLQTVYQTKTTIERKTQTEFAGTLGINRTHLNAILQGKSLPSLELAFRLARRLGSEVSELWELTEVGIRARSAHTRRR